MAQTSQEWQEETLHVDQTDLLIVKGGTGRPLLVLHDELGHPGWLKWHATLARDHTLIIPQHPGFGRTAAPEWISNIRDLAGLYSIMVRQQKLMPIDVIGFSLGGWIAAEMAAANPDQFRRMILVGACGIKPTQGEIRDIFQMMAPDQLRTSVLDFENTPEFTSLFGGIGPEQFELWEDARAQTARLAWQPYLHNPSLDHLLEVVDTPTLLIWGRQDSIVPLNAGEIYQRSIRNSRLAVFDQCGHRPEIEKLADFLRETQTFLD
ncbi:MAG TPA: alpha/beta hydrolase [Candidatus Binataceae bacterium]|jgi:pimeloyl-ACP methyl ester carboxylesterase|nr:alpha/beta hydrolase [Candidatus Binataceae bacterium]